MTRRSEDSDTQAGTSDQALAAARRLHELSMQGLERAARQQHAWAGDLLGLALAQMRTPAQAGDLGEVAAHQAGLGTQFLETTARHSREFVRLLAGQQAGLARWFEELADVDGIAAGPPAT